MKNALQRATWLKIHLYLALFIGFFFALMGLTGSISVYREAIDEFLNPQLVTDVTQPLIFAILHKPTGLP
jgi:uncharacterized iron-regulated membrane protein